MRKLINWTRNFYQQTVAELRKCTWPTWNELTESAVVVIVSVFMLGVFVALSDSVCSTIVGLLTGSL